MASAETLFPNTHIPGSQVDVNLQVALLDPLHLQMVTLSGLGLTGAEKGHCSRPDVPAWLYRLCSSCHPGASEVLGLPVGLLSNHVPQSLIKKIQPSSC